MYLLMSGDSILAGFTSADAAYSARALLKSLAVDGEAIYDNWFVNVDHLLVEQAKEWEDKKARSPE